MSIHASRTSVAVFAAGFIMLLTGAFALGTALAPASEAGKQRWQVVNLDYIAFTSTLNGDNPCGDLTPLKSRKNTVFEKGTSPVNLDPFIEYTDIRDGANIYGEKFVRCQATLRVVP